MNNSELILAAMDSICSTQIEDVDVAEERGRAIRAVDALYAAETGEPIGSAFKKNKRRSEGRR